MLAQHQISNQVLSWMFEMQSRIVKLNLTSMIPIKIKLISKLPLIVRCELSCNLDQAQIWKGS